MTKDELKKRITELYDERYSYLGALQRTERMYPPDGRGHGFKWRERIKRCDTAIDEYKSRTDLLQDGEEELYSNVNFEKTSEILVPAFQEINLEFIEYFSRNPEQLERLNWRAFEQLLGSIFRNQGYYTEIGPGSGDGGIDLRLVQKDSIGEIVTLVQAKRYQLKYAIGLQAVQALSAVVDHNKANRGLFVTTSRYLPSTRQFAEAHRDRLVLADSGDVSRWCASIMKKQD